MSYQLPEGEKKYNFCGCQCGCPPETPAKPREFTCAAAKEPVRTIKVLDTEDATNRQLYQNVLEAVQLLEQFEKDRPDVLITHFMTFRKR